MKTTLIKLNWKQLAGRLETLLQETHDPVVISSQKKFELLVDFSSLDQQLQNTPDDHVEKVLSVFSKMLIYFEAGLLFENMDNANSAVALFHQRQLRVAPDDFHDQKIMLPKTKNFQVLTTSSQVFTKKLKLNWDPENKMRAFLIRPSSDFTFVLFSPVPDLWMQTEIPKLVKSFEKIFTV